MDISTCSRLEQLYGYERMLEIKATLLRFPERDLHQVTADVLQTTRTHAKMLFESGTQGGNRFNLQEDA